jgi:hypothetical protein
VEIEQPSLAAVLDRVRCEDACVYFHDGVRKGLDLLLLGPLIRHEDALVLAGERRADAVLEKAGRPDDERSVSEVVHGHAETVHDLGRQE